MPKNDIFGRKQLKWIITIVFGIVKLIEVPNFSLNWQFWFFGPNLLQKDISIQKQKKWTSPQSSKFLGSKFHFKQFWIMGLNFPKKFYFWLTTESEHHHWILHQTILMFWTIFAKKNISSLKQKNHTCVRPWSLLTSLNFSTKGQAYTVAF